LLYQLLRYRPANTAVDLYYYDLVGTPDHLIENDLPSLQLREICKLPLTKEQPKKKSPTSPFDWILKRIRIGHPPTQDAPEPPLPGQVSLFQPDHLVVNKINAAKPDVVWLYPYWLVNWIESIECKNAIISGMDSACLHYERSLRYGNWSRPEEAQAYVDHLALNSNLENKVARTHARVHMVGQKDAEKFNSITNTQKAFFVPYPYHHYKALRKDLEQCKEEINIAVTGGNYETYVGDHLRRIVAALTRSHNTALRGTYHFHFVGNGYADYAAMLSNSGFAVSSHPWVDDYASMLSSFQLQVFPIAVGTGTKGKVLAALASGLLAIGSKLAFENINIVPGTDSIVYSEPEDLVKILDDIHQNRSVYAEMAKRATRRTRKFHAPKLTASLFWQEAVSDR
jgi:hypothetical protein